MAARAVQSQCPGGGPLRRALAGVSRLALAGALLPVSGVALAGDAVLPAGVALAAFGIRLDPTGPVGLVLLGLTAFSTSFAMLHVRARRLWNEHDERQRALIAELQSRNERLELFLASEPQVLVDWDAAGGEPGVEGDPQLLGPGITARNVTRFADWLGPVDVSTLRTAVDRLREKGEGFGLTLNALSGALIEVAGSPVAGRAVMRLRAVTGERLERARMSETVARQSELMDAFKDMLDAIPQPVWLRDKAGRLSWVNEAYVDAVEARDAQDAVTRSAPLLESATLAKIEAARRAGSPFRQEVQAVVASHRRKLDIVEVMSRTGRSGGIATDVTALDAARRDFEQQNAAHVRTLDQLQTAVALFDQNQRLAFTNRAFNELWQIDRAVLERRPTDSEMLDRLRADGKLPEHSDFREWKLGLQQSLNANETLEDVWLLPGGRSLRVVVSPSTAGGVTYLFDDITEQMHLAQSYNRLASMQGETLDSLTEGVAVFGSHGRLQLHNPAFASLWSISGDVLARGPHIDDVAHLCPADAQPVWRDIRSMVCGLPDERVSRTFETTTGGRTFAMAVTPLPDGASLLTVEDVTARVNEARAQMERNEALSEASRFKSEYLHNISFELRSPLTSVVGIAQALAVGTFGPLNDLQRTYAHDLTRATDAVLALVDDILDMTSIEAGGIAIDPGAAVDLNRAVREATDRLRERLDNAGVRLGFSPPAAGLAIRGEDLRVRQIVFNLVANAVAFADRGDEIVLSAAREGETISLAIADRGSVADARPSEALSEGGRSSGDGQSLRLAILRSLVEAHGGMLAVSQRPDGLREVRCMLPAAHAAPQRAAG